MKSASTTFATKCARACRPRSTLCRARHVHRQWQLCAAFHTSTRRLIIKQYPLADIGEGITECQIIQWRVQVGARVEEFDPLCEVASDKATTDIPSRYSGVIKKLYYEADDLAIVGKPLVDIDVDEGVASEIEKMQDDTAAQTDEAKHDESSEESITPPSTTDEPSVKDDAKSIPTSKNDTQTLATPATRHLSKQLGVSIAHVTGTGKDGRVTKDDIQRFVSERDASSTPASSTSSESKQDNQIRLSGIQMQMFKTMTKSLSIPHFLYTDSVDMTTLTSLRSRLNGTITSSSSGSKNNIKLSPLPFIVKAVSLALSEFPALNANLDTSDTAKPILTHKSSHNIGVAVDTPQGLVVPVIRDVQRLTITEIANEISRLASTARAGKLTTSDLSGATFTVSNIGSIGGGAVAPVIVAPQVAILGVGRAKEVPAFAADGVTIVKRQEAVFSWSADHRVCDGAMVARAGDRVRALLEDVEQMVVLMR